MLKRYILKNSHIVECEGGGNILVFISPNEDEKRLLVDTYKIDEHTLQSAVDPDEISRLEFEPDHIALIFKRPQNYSHQRQLLFKSSTAGIFFQKRRLILVLPEDVFLFEGKVFLKIDSLHELLLKIIYISISHFFGHLRVMNMISEELEHKIHQSMENKNLIHLFTLEKSLVYYLNAIHSNGVLLEKLKNNAGKIGFSGRQVELLEDILIENNQCYRQAEIYSNILASLMDARASIVNNNLNMLMKTLNLITIAIMVPTFVVSAFSMNVKIPLQQLKYAFWIILGLAALSVVGFTWIWKRANRR
ncbi:magnesium transporter CorA family protein [bacterium]|nr:magnesium transporter CorA family protein [bacterium]